MKKLLLAFVLGLVICAVGLTACATPEEGTFEVDLVKDGTYEVLTEISFETAAGVWNGTQLVEPSSVSVKKDDQAVSTNGYTFVLEEIGDYVITYEFNLPNGTKKTYTTEIQAVDSTAPTIVGQFDMRYRKEETVDINEEYFVLDAYDTQPEVNVKIYFGDKATGEEQTLDGTNFTPTKTGKHTVVISSEDSYGNKGEREYSFYVIDKLEFDYFNERELFDFSIVGLGGAQISFSEENVREGDGSVKYTHTGTTEVIKFPNSKDIDWASVDGLSFWVYNPSTEYDYTFSFGGYTSLGSGFTGNGNKASMGYTISKNSWSKIVVPSEQIIKMTEKTATAPDGAPYLGILISHENNGGSQSNRWANIELYFDYFTLDAKWEHTLTGSLMTVNAVVNTNKPYFNVAIETKTVGQTTQEMTVLTHNAGAFPSATFSASNIIDWDENKLTFKVYNPTDLDLKLQIRSSKYEKAMAAREEIESTNPLYTKLINTVVFTKKATTTVTIDYTEIDYVNFPYIMLYAYGLTSEEQEAFELWFYDFEMSDSEKATPDYLWTQTALGSTGSFKTAVNTDNAYIKEGSFSLHAKPNGTWNTFTFIYAAKIDQSKVSSISFDVYNPNNFDLVLGIGSSWATFVAKKGQWTTVTVTDLANAIRVYDTETDINSKKGTGLEIKLTHGNSLTEGLVTYTNPAAASEDWATLQANGLYFDNFVVNNINQ